MEAGSNGTARAKPAQYVRHLWGEVICGSKDQLQALGLGIGLAFPGEAACPERSLRILDPRGLACSITASAAAGYRAEIRYPWVPPQPRGRFLELPNGARLERSPFGDSYEGTAEALEALGVVEARHLPGAPGMDEENVVIRADGSVATGERAGDGFAKQPGAKWIARVDGQIFRVDVWLDDEEARWRRAAYAAQLLTWEKTASAAPRPAALQPMPAELLGGFARASAAATADQAFQRFLARLQ